MTKAQREKAERVMLKHMLDTNPKLKKTIDALMDNPHPDVKSAVQPVIEEELNKARMTGILIGWQTAFIQTYEKIKNMQSVDDIKVCLRNEADKMRKQLGLKSAFDEKGNLITEEDEEENQGKD